MEYFLKANQQMKEQQKGKKVLYPTLYYRKFIKIIVKIESILEKLQMATYEAK